MAVELIVAPWAEQVIDEAYVSVSSRIRLG